MLDTIRQTLCPPEKLAEALALDGADADAAAAIVTLWREALTGGGGEEVSWSLIYNVLLPRGWQQSALQLASAHFA